MSKKTNMDYNETLLAEKKAIKKYKEKQGKKGVSSEEIEEPKKKLTGPLFFVMLGLALVSDTLGLLLSVTVVFSMLAPLFGMIFSLLILIYLWGSGVKPTTKKITTFIISFIIELIPFIDGFIPATTINLILIRVFENSDRLKKIAEKKTKSLAKN